MKTKLEVYPTPELLARLDRWRGSQPVPLPRAAAARLLITMALDAQPASPTSEEDHK